MRRLLVLVPLLAACTAPPTAAPSAPPAPTVAPVAANAGEAPQTFTGDHEAKTAAFALRGGDYTITWQATASSSVGCYHSGTLHSATDKSVSEQAGSGDVKGTQTGMTSVFGLAAGRYYFDMISGCKWKVTIGPQ